jgi:hypothetical protein
VSAIFCFAQQFGYSELSHFYDFNDHSATVTSSIMVENSIISRCYSTQSFLIYYLAFFTIFLNHFVFCYSELNYFCNIAHHFLLLY